MHHVTPISSLSLFTIPLTHIFHPADTLSQAPPPAKLRRWYLPHEITEYITAQLTNTTMWSNVIIYLTFICALQCIHPLSVHSHTLCAFTHSQCIHTLFVHSHTLCAFTHSQCIHTLSVHSPTLSAFTHSLCLYFLTLLHLS